MRIHLSSGIWVNEHYDRLRYSPVDVQKLGLGPGLSDTRRMSGRSGELANSGSRTQRNVVLLRPLGGRTRVPLGGNSHAPGELSQLLLVSTEFEHYLR